MTSTRHRHALAAALALGVLLLGAARARADVRVDDPEAPEPELAIRISPAGPWSLVGPFDSTVLNPSGDAFGDAMNVAFKLGEDVAKRGEILVGMTAFEAARAAGCTFDGCAAPTSRVEELGGVTVPHMSLRLTAEG